MPDLSNKEENPTMAKKLFLICIISILLLSACGTNTTAAVPTLETNVEVLPTEIVFEHASFVSVGDHPTSVISGDFDQDGDQDLAITNDGNGTGETVSVLL